MPLRVLAQRTTLWQWCRWAHMQFLKRQEAGRREEWVLNLSFLGIQLLSTAPGPQPLVLAPLSFCRSSSPSFLHFPLPLTFLSDSFTFINKIPQYNPDGTNTILVVPGTGGSYPPPSSVGGSKRARLSLPCPTEDLCHNRHSCTRYPADISVPGTSSPQGLQGSLFAGLDAAFPARWSQFDHQALCSPREMHRYSCHL